MKDAWVRKQVEGQMKELHGKLTTTSGANNFSYISGQISFYLEFLEGVDDVDSAMSFLEEKETLMEKQNDVLLEFQNRTLSHFRSGRRKAVRFCALLIQLESQ